MAYCDQAGLEIALGGQRILTQLADYNGDGVADAPVVTDYLESGAAELRTAVEVKHDPETIANLDAVSLRRLYDANAALSARIAWEKGAKGAAMPEWVRERAERADKFADDLSKGFRRLGRAPGAPAAATTQAANAGVVDFDPNGDGGSDRSGNRATRISVTGLKNGFR